SSCSAFFTSAETKGLRRYPEGMATREQAVPENVPGPFFVDTTCIDCDTCRQLATATFGETAEFSFVRAQPRSAEERRAAVRALIACPTGSIGEAVAAETREALADFP